jgi:CBS domain-containing protein
MKPVGIFTNRDIRRMIIKRRLDGLISEFMTSPVIRIGEDVSVLEAYATLIRTGIDHLVVVSSEDQVLGVVTSKDILAQIEPSSSILTIYRKIVKATDLDVLTTAFKSVANAAAQMALKGIPFYHLSPLLTSVYDTVAAKVIELNISKATANDFLWIHVGSSGRKEQIFATDQDNLIMCGPSGSQIAFAKAVNDDLDRIGISKCPAGYMASNPSWHQSIETWKEYFAKWCKEPVPEHIRLLTVFLDLRLIYGDEEIFYNFLDHIYRNLTNQTLRFLAYDATLAEPPIGIFGLKHPERGIDLKRFGIYPIVNGIRVMALDNQILHITNTRDRIEKLREEGFIGMETARDLLEAYEFLQKLRLRYQAESIVKGTKYGNTIYVDKIEKLDVLLLKESLKIVSSFQKNLRARYGVDRGI